MKVFKNTTIPDSKGEPIEIAFPDKEARPVDLKEILWLILNNAPYQSQQDSINGMKLAQALDGSKDGLIKIQEDDVYDWLKTIAQRVTPPLFKLVGNIVYKHICEGFEEVKKEE